MCAVAFTFADLLRATWPQHTAKRTSRVAGRPIASAKNWLQHRCTPSADLLLQMAAENAELRAELLRRLGAFDEDADATMAGAGVAPGRRAIGSARGSGLPAAGGFA